MPPDSTSGTGQVPPTSQSSDSNGQVPPGSQASSNGDDSANGNPEPSSLSPEQLQDALKKAREQAAKYRIDGKELAELRAYKQQQEEAKLSTDEKRDKALAAAQERAAQAEERAQRVAVTAEAKLVARDLGIKTELALKLLDFAEIEFDESGDPTNVTKLLEKAVAEYGIAPTPAATATNGNGRAAASRQPTSLGSTPANPARSATSGGPAGGWSWEAISSLTKEQYEGLTPAQRAAMSQFISSHPKR